MYLLLILEEITKGIFLLALCVGIYSAFKIRKIKKLSNSAYPDIGEDIVQSWNDFQLDGMKLWIYAGLGMFGLSLIISILVTILLPAEISSRINRLANIFFGLCTSILAIFAAYKGSNARKLRKASGIKI